ncbi:MAG: Ig-like domain-containing protein, partial [Treponema sp.]|nr:Ig-like domain-containing protein [Treponema sp.]
KNGSTSTRYTTPVAITADVTIKAIAVKNGWHDSGILEAVYTVTVVGFIPVTGIDNVPATATVGKPLTLPSVGAPANADNKDVVWSVKGGAAISGDFNPNAEGVVTLTATIAHGLSDTEDFIQDYSIIVLKPADEVLWAWNKADQPWAALPNNPGGDNNVWSNGYSSWKSDAYLSVPVSIYATTGTNAQPVPADKDGMVVGGTSGGYGGQRFAIGITPGTATFGASGPYPKVGAFDLTHGILRVTVEYQNVKASAANRYLIRVAINNNSGTAANSPLGADSYIGNLNGGTLTSDDQVYDSFDSSTGLINRSSSEIVYSGSVIETYPGLSNDGRGAAVMTASPAVFYAQTGNSGIESLANAFIQIMAQAGDAVGGDNYITWNSIKIERLNDPGEIIPVYDITASAVLSTVEGTPLTLDATVLPTIATNKTVTWSVSDAGTTGASFSGNTLNTTGPGTATVTATVSNGIAQGENFIKDFEITVFPNDAIIPVTGITGVSPELHLGTPLELTGVVAPASATNQTIVWSIDASDDGSAHPSVSGNILNATTAGTVKVLATIIDGIDDGVNYTHVFTIAVPDPNSIFEWIYSRDGGITAGTFTSTNAYITGKGPLGDLNVKVRSPDAATLNPPTVSMETEGIHINASGASTRVVIGYNSTTAVGILNTWFDNGTFDFSSATANGRWIQISAEYKIVTAATNTARFIHIQVNNNSNTAAATDSLLGVASRIGTLGPNPVLAAGTEDTFTAKFNPADFDSSADAKTSLNKAFIAIGGASGSGGYDFIIKSIKIEFVPAPTVQSVTITGPGVAGTPKALSVNLAGDPNKTVQLTGTIAPSDAVGTIVWTTDNAAYVDVDQTGQITAKQVTTNPVTITAMAGGKSDTVEVTVVDNSTAVDPNLIFEWTVADGEPAGMVWTNGSSA